MLRLAEARMVNFKMSNERFLKLQEAVRKCKWHEARNLSDFIRRVVDAAVDAKLASVIPDKPPVARPQKKIVPMSASRRRKSATR